MRRMWEAQFIEFCERGFERYGKITLTTEEKLEAIYRDKSK